MTDRIIDISRESARLNIRVGRLLIRLEEEEHAVALSDIAALVLANPRITCSQSVLAKLAEAGAPIVACDERSMPVGMMLPLNAHHVQTERFAQQSNASMPTRKRLWKQIVRAKVKAQGRLLQRLRGFDAGLFNLAARVRSGDPQNIEAQASRRYWPLLFDDPDFRRRRDAPDQNRMLNYGYAILRATVARALCAAGLHPSLGLHHKNRYDTFSLADDIMEPFRPLVDEAVVECVREYGADSELNPDLKRSIIEGVTGRYELNGESRVLFDILGRTAFSLAAVYAGEANELSLPEI